MPDFRVVPGPVLAPGRCGGCGRHAGEMVDLMFRPDDPALSPYLCKECVWEAARLVGCLDPLQAEEAQARLMEARARIVSLEGELEFERDNKVVSVSDMLRLMDRRDAVSTPVGEPKIIERGLPVVVETTPDEAAETAAAAKMERAIEAANVKTAWQGFTLCSALKKDGSPCTAHVLPGWDVCVAHSRAREKV